MKVAIWFLKTSLVLDMRLLTLKDWTLSKKLEFLFKKYLIIARHWTKEFSLGKDSVELFGEKIYYDSRYGLAGYQGILTRHRNLLRTAGVKEVNTALDIGANVGFFSLLLGEMYPKAKIYSIEPVPMVFQALTKNLLGFKNVKSFNLALSDKKGQTKMTFDSQDSAISSIDKSGSVQVQTTTLDNFVSENKIKQIDLLKIDTEGHEMKVLSKGKKALAATRYLFMEITIQDNNKYTISEVMGMLKGKGYNFQLKAFRNFADKGEGKIPIMDCVFENVEFKSKK